jgi:hypothetical protein
MVHGKSNSFVVKSNLHLIKHNEPTPTHFACKMDGVWIENTFSLNLCPIINHNDNETLLIITKAPKKGGIQGTKNTHI